VRTEGVSRVEVSRVEVRQRCDTQQVNGMARRERHHVAAESDTPQLISAFLNPGLQYPGRDHNREGAFLLGANHGNGLMAVKALP